MIAILTVEKSYISVGGSRIRFVEEGEDPPPVLIHGLGGSLEWWKYNINSFFQNNRVIALDFLGFGSELSLILRSVCS